jgi:rhodanese-related sulfurtransferase
VSTSAERRAPRPTTSTGSSPRSALDLDTEVVVHCRNAACTDSAYVAEQLETVGFRNVRRYVGGKHDWVDAGLPVETPVA